MMEYSCFDFGPLGVEKTLSTFEDFAHFADVLVVCARDMVIKHATKDICIKKTCSLSPCYNRCLFQVIEPDLAQKILM